MKDNNFKNCPTEREPLNRKQQNDINTNKIIHKKASLLHRLEIIRKSITVEPTVALFVIPHWLALLATENLNLEKACRVNLDYGDEICDALHQRQTGNYSVEEANVQKLVASMTAWKSVLHTGLPCLLIIFIGSWSDKTGKRRLCILAPIIGDLITNLGLVLNTYFFYELPMEVAGFTETGFAALSGSAYVLFMGAFSYIGDITSIRTRTFRIGVLNLFITLANPIGMSLSGILLKYFGYYGVFSIAASLNFVGFLYAFFFLQDPERNGQVSEVGGCCETIRSFFDFNQVKETFSIVFQKGKNHRRLRVILIAICSFLVFGVITGETAINYLFMRFRFNWDALEFSIFSTYDVIVHFIGTLFAISFFSRYLHWNDALIAIIALLGKLFSTSIYVFATEKWMIYTAPVVEIFRGASTVAIRSMGSKLVSSENLGKLYSIFGLIEAAVPIIFGPIYAKTYAATLDVLPGAIYVLGAAISIPVISIFGYLIYLGQGGVKETTPCLNRPE